MSASAYRAVISTRIGRLASSHRSTLGTIAIPLLACSSLAACDQRTPTPTEIPSSEASMSQSMTHSAGASGFVVQVLSRSGFPDLIDAMFSIRLDRGMQVVRVDDPTEVVVAKVILEPGGSLGWHTHPGPAIASVAAGELSIINASDCVLRLYPAGKAFLDPGQGNVHIGFNSTSVETVVYVTFLDVPPGQSPTIAAQEPDC